MAFFEFGRAAHIDEQRAVVDHLRGGEHGKHRAALAAAAPFIDDDGGDDREEKQKQQDILLEELCEAHIRKAVKKCGL